MKTEKIPYSKAFIASTNSGWGCGYVTIPNDHPIMTLRKLPEFGDYMQPKGFSETITWSELEDDGLQIGFDTAHSWCSPNVHNEEWVDKKILELVDAINKTTKEEVVQIIVNSLEESVVFYKNLIKELYA